MKRKRQEAFGTLPVVLVKEIIDFLDVRSKLRLHKTCQKWRKWLTEIPQNWYTTLKLPPLLNQPNIWLYPHLNSYGQDLSNLNNAKKLKVSLEMKDEPSLLGKWEFYSKQPWWNRITSLTAYLKGFDLTSNLDFPKEVETLGLDMQHSPLTSYEELETLPPGFPSESLPTLRKLQYYGRPLAKDNLFRLADLFQNLRYLEIPLWSSDLQKEDFIHFFSSLPNLQTFASHTCICRSCCCYLEGISSIKDETELKRVPRLENLLLSKCETKSWLPYCIWFCELLRPRHLEISSDQEERGPLDESVLELAKVPSIRRLTLDNLVGQWWTIFPYSSSEEVELKWDWIKFTCCQFSDSIIHTLPPKIGYIFKETKPFVWYELSDQAPGVVPKDHKFLDLQFNDSEKVRTMYTRITS